MNQENFTYFIFQCTYKITLNIDRVSETEENSKEILPNWEEAINVLDTEMQKDKANNILIN